MLMAPIHSAMFRGPVWCMTLCCKNVYKTKKGGEISKPLLKNMVIL